MGAKLQVRFNDERMKKFNQLQAQTGLTVSEIIQQLVDVAEIKTSAEICGAKLSVKNNSSAIHQDAAAVVRA